MIREGAPYIQGKLFVAETLKKSEIYNIKNKLESKIQNFISTEIEWIPINNVEVNGEQIENATQFLEILEDDDDVQHVYTNLKFGSN